MTEPYFRLSLNIPYLDGKQMRNEKKSISPVRIVLRILLIVIETAALVALAAYLVLYIHFRGPSSSAGKDLASMLSESSALKFVPELFYSEDEMETILAYQDFEYEGPTTDISMIIDAETESSDKDDTENTVSDEWTLKDEDGDGIIVEEIHGSGYSGYLMTIKDRNRVIMGSVPSSFGSRGYTVEEMVQEYGAIAGINAGGFLDVGGQGDGSTPDSVVVFEGKTYYAELGMGKGFVGLDSNGILHVGLTSVQQIQDADIQYGVCFGPVLVVNGEIPDESALDNGPNPRTAIGQRADGALLLLVIDGRQGISIGASYLDIAKIMLNHGAINACNLDGGSSTLMWFEGKYINNCASLIGIRPVPSTFLVMPQGWSGGKNNE